MLLFAEEDFHQPAGNGEQVIAGAQVEHRRHKMGVELENAGRGFADVGDLHGRTALAAFALEQQPEIFAGHHDRPLGLSRILIADHLDLGAVAGLHVADPIGDVPDPARDS